MWGEFKVELLHDGREKYKETDGGYVFSNANPRSCGKSQEINQCYQKNPHFGALSIMIASYRSRMG